MTTIENIPKLIMTSYMKRCAKLVDLILEVILDITNCVRSHMKIIRWYLYHVLLLTKFTGYNISICMIYNVTVTGQ